MKMDSDNEERLQFLINNRKYFFIVLVESCIALVRFKMLNVLSLNLITSAKNVVILLVISILNVKYVKSKKKEPKQKHSLQNIVYGHWTV